MHERAALLAQADDQPPSAAEAMAPGRAGLGGAGPAVRVGVAVASVGLLLWLVDWRGSLAQLAQARPGPVAVAAGLAALGIAISAWKWQRLLAALSIQAPLGPLLGFYWASAFVGTFLPSTLPGDALRVALARRFGAATAVAASIVAERVTGLATLFLLATLASLARPDLLPEGPLRALVPAAAVTCALLLTFGGLPAGLGRLVRVLPGRAGGALTRFGAALREVGRRRGALLVACAASTAFYAALAASHWAVFQALGVADVGVAEIAAVAPLVALAAALPVSPNGLGLSEGAFVLLYAQAGATPEQALAAALLRRLVVTLVTLVGGVPWLAARGALTRWAPATLAEPDPTVVAVAVTPSAARVGTGLTRPWPRPGPRQLATYVVGCTCFSLGVKCFIDADLGVDPLHAMVIGIVAAAALPAASVGPVVSAVTLAMLVGWSAACRRLPPLSIFVTMALTGYLVDTWGLLRLENWLVQALPPAGLLVLGLVLDAAGSALIIASGVGIRVVDLVALALMERLGWRFMVAKLAVEGCFCVVALALGGPLGVATAAFLVVVGPFMEPVVWASHRFLGLPQRGGFGPGARVNDRPDGPAGVAGPP